MFHCLVERELEGGRAGGTVQFSADGAYVMAPRVNGWARVWKASTGKQQAQIKVPDIARGSAFSPDAKLHVISYKESGVARRSFRRGKAARLNPLKEPWVEGLGAYSVGLRDHELVTEFSSSATTASQWPRRSGSAPIFYFAEPRAGDKDPGLRLGWRKFGPVAWRGGWIDLRLQPFRLGVFSPNGRLLAAAGNDGRLSLLDVDAGQNRWGLELPSAVSAVRFSPCSQSLLASLADGRALSIDVNSGVIKSEPAKEVTGVTVSCWSPDGKTLIAGTRDGRLLILEVGSGLCLSDCRLHDGPVRRLTFCGDSRIVSVSSSTVGISDVETGRVVFRGAGNLAALHPNGKYIACFDHQRSGRLDVLDPVDGTTLWSLSERVQAACFSLDGTNLVAWSGAAARNKASNLMRIAAESGEQLGRIRGPRIPEDIAASFEIECPDWESGVLIRPRAHEDIAVDLNWVILVNEAQGSNASTLNRLSGMWPGRKGCFISALISRAGKYDFVFGRLTSQSDAPQVRWSRDTGAKVVWCPDDSRVAILGDDGCVEVLDSNGTLIARTDRQAAQQSLRPIGFDRCCSRLLFLADHAYACVTGDHEGMKMPRAALEPIVRLDPWAAPTDSVNLGRLSNSGNLAVLVYRSGRAVVVNARTGQIHLNLEIDPARGPRDIAFSESDQYFVITFDDGSFSVLEAETGRPRHSVGPQGARIDALRVARDGSTVATIQGSSLRVWGIADGSDGVSSRLPFHQDGLPISSAEELAVSLRVSVSFLNSAVASVDTHQYQSFAIPKRGGGVRRIDAPKPGGKIRFLQNRIMPMLQRAHDADPAAHGFVCGKSIVSNANMHIGKRWVLNVDLKDFFPTISLSRVRGIFRNQPFNMGEEAADLMAKICTRHNALPQGASTSPVLSNFVARHLDRSLNALAVRHGLVYTRYADDITLSTSAANFPASVAFRIGGGPSPRTTIAGSELTAAIQDCDFRLHPGKVRLQHQSDRQVVTGLIVNEKLSPARKHIRNLRAMIHSWETVGLEAAACEHFRRSPHKIRRGAGKPAVKDFRSVVYGYLAFLKMVRGDEDAVFIRFCRKLRALDQQAPPHYVRESIDRADGKRGITA